MTDCPNFISITELAERVGVSKDSGYRAARRREIPGLFTIGKLLRINWQAFLKALEKVPDVVA